jgi:GH15 family glucan-1,4-alpha-glucosidase
MSGLGDYGLIGNCRTAALVSRHGSIDWLCLPHFSGASIFAALVDEHKGGRFSIGPRNVARSSQRYLGDTNVLETTFECAEGVLRLTDFMPLEGENTLDRIAECVSGSVEVDVLYQPRPDYARRIPALRREVDGGWSFGNVVLHADRELRIVEEGTLASRFTLRAGESAGFSINGTPGSQRARLGETATAWRQWLSPCRYAGPYAPALRRTCLVLKLLTFNPTGAIIAAPTTSLPAAPEGDRNWDYRYCWLRDASLVLGCFIELGFEAEAAAFRQWLLHATRSTHPRLQVLYDVHGEPSVGEHVLGHLAGHGSRRPVRIGNAAHGQVQLDVYGEVLAAIAGQRLDPEEKRCVAGFGDSVRELWRSPDHGIWEIRSEPRHHTHSKVMCWASLDALLKMRLPIDEAATRQARDAIRDDVERHAFDASLGSFVGYYGGTAADATALLMPRRGFLPADDPRMASTFEYIERTLAVGPLVYRYPPENAYDGTGAPDNFFGACAFWRVDWLARAGRVDEAASRFEELLALATPLGLYAEGFDTDRKPAGNFPQAFTHVELLHAGLVLEGAMMRSAKTEGPCSSG